MKIPLPGGRSLELTRQKAPKSTGKEQGATGINSPGYFELESYLGRVKNPSIKQIMDMIDNDGTAQGLYNFMTFPVMATQWHIQPDPADVVKGTDGSETHPQADFIESCLRNPEHKGGMSTPFSLVLSNILLGLAQGYRFFEIVYKLDDEGRVVFKKVAPREAKEIDIQSDETGGFAGVKQKVKRGNKTETVTIEIPYCFLYTYRKERDPLKGMSAFRAGFYHYDKKHRLYYLMNQQGQVSAIPLKVLEEPETTVTKEVRDENLAAVDKMAVRPSIALPFGWKLTIHDASKGAINLQPYADHQDIQMARAVLAQGMLQGNSSQSSGGSYSLGEVHFDSFMLGELALMNGIAEHVTTYLIAKLHDYNFDTPLYSSFKFEKLTDDVAVLLKEGFKSLIAKGAVPKWVANGMSEKVAERLQIDRPEEEGIESDDNDYIGVTDSPAPADEPALSRSSKKKVSRLAKNEWWRELTAAEAKVQFSAIESAADKAEDAMLEDLRPVFDKVSADATKRLKPLLTEKGAKALDGFELKFDADLRKVMTDHMVDMYSNAKTAAADEIKQKAPANKQKSKDLIAEHSKAIVEKQYGDMLFNLKTIVTDAVRKNQLDKQELSVGEVIATIAAMFDAFFDEKEPLTVSSLITTAINIGRDDVFQEYGDKIYGYQYSAILDDVVCKVCEDLDGSVVTEAVYFSTKWMPPIHFNCRCIWVAIMEDETDKPPYTGLPDAPGGTTEPSLAYQHIDENSLSAAVEYRLYLSKQAEALWRKKRY